MSEISFGTLHDHLHEAFEGAKFAVAPSDDAIRDWLEGGRRETRQAPARRTTRPMGRGRRGDGVSGVVRLVLDAPRRARLPQAQGECVISEISDRLDLGGAS